MREDLRPMPKEYNNSLLLRCGLVECAAKQLKVEGAEYATLLAAENEQTAAMTEQILTQRLNKQTTASGHEGDDDYDEFWVYDGNDNSSVAVHAGISAKVSPSLLPCPTYD